MASESINGTYPTNGQSFEGGQFASANDVAQTEFSASRPNNAGIPKDQVGWYFVEQYYITLSKNPEKLHHFYNKSSQFVSGTEAEKVSVCVGQKAISDRIKELDFQDCKVRVTNVDSQGSRSNIVIQVIGEISTKQQPQRKFTQTFVLAEQPNGYFVLNDIFRYVVEEDDYEGDEGNAQPVEENKVETAPEEKIDAPEPEVEEKQESVVEETVNGTSDTVMAEDATATEEEPVVEEQPKEPEPTRATSPVKSQAPSKPSGPKSWASIAGGNRVAPVVPVVPTPPQKSPAPQAQQTQAPPTLPPAPVSNDQEVERSETPNSASEWQTAGHEHTRKQSRAQVTQPQAEVTRGYIKNVTDVVEVDALQTALSAVAKITYFDVSRPKSCCFVEYATPNDFRAAVEANPYEVNGQRLTVVERILRDTRGFPPRGGFRGGRGGPANGPQRGGPPRDSRGGAPNRGRGGLRGRGAPQAA